MKKPYQQTPKYVLACDWETTGADFGQDSSLKYQGISFGAIVADASTFEPIEKLYVEIKFDGSKWAWTDEAFKIHGLSKEHLEEHGITQEDAAIKMAELILRYWGPDGKVMFLGHNTEFDRRFTNQLLNQIGIEFSIEKKTDLDSWIQLHHVMLDTSALGFITLGIFKSDMLFDKMGLPERAEHSAMQDIEYTLETCKAIRGLVDYAMKGLE